MTLHVTISPAEAADRLAIRELVEGSTLETAVMQKVRCLYDGHQLRGVHERERPNALTGAFGRARLLLRCLPT